MLHHTYVANHRVCPAVKYISIVVCINGNEANHMKYHTVCSSFPLCYIYLPSQPHALCIIFSYSTGGNALTSYCA